MTRRPRLPLLERAFASAWVIAGAVACAPTFSDDETRVTAPRLIAAIAEPAEVAPRRPVTLRAVRAPADSPGQLEVAFCTSPAAVGDPRPVAEACLVEPGIPLVVDGDVATGTVPPEACSRYGPDPPPGDHRPEDADDTGGFHQPVRIRAFGETYLAAVRIQCVLPDAPADVARELAEQYVANTNPAPPSLELRGPNGWGPAAALPANTTVTLRARWEPGSREDYVWLPPGGDTLEARSESLRIAWFSTAGAFREAVTGSGEGDAATSTTNAFDVSGEGQVTIWLVLRDSRGGTAVLEQRIEVRP